MMLDGVKYLCFAISISTISTKALLNIELNAVYNSKTLDQIWTSTGFSPPATHQHFHAYVKSDAFKQNILMIGSLGYRHQLFQIRIHWLMDLIKVKSGGNYDFAYLDQLIEMCTIHGLSIGFELMGNPGGIFNNFENRTQVYLWKRLVSLIAQRYSHLHSNWNYETWNEPDHHDFDNLNFTTEGYLNYVDACEKGVHDVDDEVRFGGPGASCRQGSFSRLCWKFMDHITTGVNYFTKQVGTRIDFISFHKKGGKRGSAGSSDQLYQSEQQTLSYILFHYQKLTSKLFYNDEGDPVVGWDEPMSFRADARYPAMVIRLIHYHLYGKSKFFDNYKMTSNDNAFLSYKPFYFTQRTLFASFTVNNTAVPYTILVRKPIFELMTMLAQVRGQLIILPSMSKALVANKTSGYIISQTKYQISISIWASNDTNQYTAKPLACVINLPSHMMMGYYIIRELNHEHPSSYDVWQRMGSPGNLSQLQTELLWNTTMVKASRPARVRKDILVKVAGPGMTQLIACTKFENLRKPYNLLCENITTNIVIMRWEDDELSDCFLTYELEIRRTPSDKFTLINNGILLTRAYQFTSQYGVIGDYRVRSRNILDQTSKYSDMTQC